ncbi:hypothetical protein V5799_031347, partial [Amblyomma americanum]
MCELSASNVLLFLWSSSKNTNLKGEAGSSVSMLNSRPWDPRNDVVQFERNGVIQSKTRHQTPIVPSGGSLVSIEGSPPEPQGGLRRRILHSSPRQAAAHLGHRHHHHHHHHHHRQQQQQGSGVAGSKKERKKKVGPALGLAHSGSSSAERGACFSCDSTDSE